MRYFKIYFKLLQLSWAALLIYRSNFLNSIISGLIWSSFNLTAILLLTAKTSTVFGWTRNELVLLIGVSNILVGIFYFFFSINLYDFPNTVNLGKLDSILLKPIDTQFAISFWEAAYKGLVRMIFGICISVYMLSVMHIQVTIFSTLLFIIFLFFGIMLQYSIWFGITSITIKYTTLSNIADLLYNTNDFARFPPEMFRQGKEFLYFFLFPFTLITVVPVKSLLSRATMLDVFWLLCMTGLLFYLSRKFFNFALRFYTSASG
jgi:ABC-2 type transport system permease protein